MNIDDFDKKQDRKERFTQNLAENKYLQMKEQRPALAQMYVQQKKMADPKVSYTLDNAVQFVAECQEMCPEYERHEREYTQFLEPFEKIPGTERVDHSKAVKRYKRSAAGDPPPLPCDVRPPAVLFKTLDYLFHDIITQYGLEQSHGFVRDRARSIRNDLTLQNYRGVEAVILHERIARYHIMCSNILCGVEGFVMQQELEQLRKTLLSLVEFYSEMQKKGVNMPHEPEFQAYFILTFPWNNDAISRLEAELSPKVFFDPKVQLAIEIRSLMTRRQDKKRPSVDGSLNHYAKIFEIVRRNTTSYLFACCVHMHFSDIRIGALRAMQKSYTFQGDNPQSGIHLQDVIDSLGFDGADDCIQFLDHYFVKVSLFQGQQIAYIGRKVTDRNGKKEREFPKFPYSVIPDNVPSVKSNLIERKREGISYIDVLDGKFNHVVHKPANIDLPGFVSPVKSFAEPRLSSSSKKSPLFKTPPTNLPTKDFGKSQPLKKVSFSSQLEEKVIPARFSFTNPSNINPLTAAPNPIIEQPPKIQEFKPVIPLAAPTFAIPVSSNFLNTSSNRETAIQPTVSVLPFPTPAVHESNPISTQSYSFVSPQASNSPVPSSYMVNNRLQSPSIIPPSSKVKLSKRYTEQEEVIDKIIAQEVHSLLQDEVNLEFAGLQMQAQCETVFDTLFTEFVFELVQAKLNRTRRLSAFREALLTQTEKLVEEVLREELIFLIEEDLGKKRQQFNLQRFAWDRWKFFAHYQLYKREKNYLLKQRMLSFLRQAALAPTLIIPNAPVTIATRDSVIESRLTNLSNEMSKRRSQWYHCVRWQNEVTPLLQSNPSPGMKILFHHDLTEHPSGTISWFTHAWLRAKLSQSNSPPYMTKVNCTTNDFERFQLLINECPQELLAHKQHNSLSNNSGLNALIFMADYFDSALSKREYWSRTKNSLAILKSQIPSFSKLPLLVVYWPSDDLDVPDFEHSISKLIPEVLESEVTTIGFLPLQISYENFDSVSCTNALVEKLAWLIDNAAPQPQFETNILKSIPTVIQTMEWGFRKLHELVPGEMRLMPSVHSYTMNYFIKIYNLFIQFVTDSLTGPELFEVAFPAQELANFSVDWNSVASFQNLKHLGSLSMLPNAPLSDKRGVNVHDISNLYLLYLDMLVKLPGYDHTLIETLRQYLSTHITPELRIDELFFKITNTTLSFFVPESKLLYRPFLSPLINENSFTEQIHFVLREFTNTWQKRTVLDEDTQPRKKPKHETTKVQEALDRLERAMRAAKHTLEHRQ